MNNISEVEDTIRHEIAHIKAGHAAGHGPLWQIWAVRIGAKPERCNTTAAMPTHKWKNVCLNCGQTTRLLHRRTDVSNRHSVCCKSKIQTVANVAA